MADNKSVQISGVPPSHSNQLVSGDVLRRVARKMYPFYREITVNPRYAAEWSQAARALNAEKMLRMLRRVSPKVHDPFMPTNGLGYTVSFRVPKPVHWYGSGTLIPPGSVRFYFETRAHRAIARAVLPLYWNLAANEAFAHNLAKAIRRKDTDAVRKMVRGLVQSRCLQSVTISESGIAMKFRFPYSRYTYMHYLFHDNTV